LLMAEGCDVVQGYFSGQPMSAKQLQQLVERQSTMLAEAGASRAAAAFADPLPTIARAAIEHGANTD
jgi:hypothetical protein